MVACSGVDGLGCLAHEDLGGGVGDDDLAQVGAEQVLRETFGCSARGLVERLGRAALEDLADPTIPPSNHRNPANCLTGEG
jgi:hypothetical protein